MIGNFLVGHVQHNSHAATCCLPMLVCPVKKDVCHLYLRIAREGQQAGLRLGFVKLFGEMLGNAQRHIGVGSKKLKKGQTRNEAHLAWDGGLGCR